jgi:nucleoside-diphosphate-sugar epimerase
MSNSTGLRVVVTGATGNVGTKVVQALGEERGVSSIVGVARRRSEWSLPKTEFAVADVGSDDLTQLLGELMRSSTWHGCSSPRATRT